MMAEMDGKSGIAFCVIPATGGWSVRKVRFENGRVLDVTDEPSDTKPIALSKVFTELERSVGL